MRTSKVNGEYELTVHAIDGSISIYRLDKSKCSLFALGRGEASDSHLSDTLIPDDLNSNGNCFLSSMQCYFAWDQKIADWVVGNGKPPNKYIPQAKQKHYADISAGPTTEHNRVYYCPNSTRNHNRKSTSFDLLREPVRCSNALGIAFLHGEDLRYNGQELQGHFARNQDIRGGVPFGYLIEISPMLNLMDTI